MTLSPYQAVVTAESNLAAFWPMNETTGTTLKDISGNGKNGTITPGGILTLGAPGLLTGDTNTAISSTGASGAGYITVPDLAISSGSFSVEFWAYCTGAGGAVHNHATVYAIPTGGKFIWIVGASNAPVLIQFNSDNFNGGTNTNTNTRYHGVFVWDGTSEYLFINSILYNTRTGPVTTPTWNNSGVLFQTSTSSISYWYAGTIQNVAVYAKALSGDSIRLHYETGIQGRTRAPTRTLATARTHVLK